MPETKELGAQLLAELDLVGDPSRTVGRPAKNLYVAYSRDLTEADMEALALPRTYAPKTLARLRASHHSLARCLASGMKPAQASLVTGYAQSSISTLLTEPSFQALVQDYRNEAKGIFADLAERMSDISLDAIELLQEKLHENPEQLTVPMLLDIVKTFADRTGHGPNQEVNLKVSTDFIDRPPRESFDDWERRRTRELVPPGEVTAPAASDVSGPGSEVVSELDLEALAPGGGPPKKLLN